MECFLKMKETANFFWHGPSLSLYEIYCLSSFLEQGFTVNLWTFKKYKVPTGINLKNVDEFFKIEDINKFVQDGTEGSLAAFSDAVRYHVLNSYGGWWFDTDCFCLKAEKEFKNLKTGKKIIAGWEDSKHINGAVLSFQNKELAKKSISMLYSICEEKNYKLSWGDIGPKLITLLVKDTNTINDILDQKYFYPIHYKEALKFLDPNSLNELTVKTKDSFVIHLWNEILKKNNINKNQFPPTNSFLYKKFLKININE
jgi:hypothetical protein